MQHMYNCKDAHLIDYERDDVNQSSKLKCLCTNTYWFNLPILL